MEGQDLDEYKKYIKIMNTPKPSRVDGEGLQNIARRVGGGAVEFVATRDKGFADRTDEDIYEVLCWYDGMDDLGNDIRALQDAYKKILAPPIHDHREKKKAN
tara:strand:- start:278 stop:583 length:306 start_codon:yes stop_codon:yes gene_type:complete